MVLEPTEKQFIFDYSLQLLQHDILTNAAFAGSAVGKDLRSLVLQNTPRTHTTNPSEQSLNSRLRTDSRTLAMAADNLSEAKSLYETAQTASSSIKSSLTRMKDIIEKVDDGTYTQADVQSEYDNLFGSISSQVQNTDYNGMKLLDGSNWGTDDRFTVNGDHGIFEIFAGGSNGINMSLNNLYDDLVDDGSPIFASTDLDAANRATALATVTARLSQMTTISDSYSNIASSLGSQSDSLDTQSNIADQAARNRAPDSTKSLEELLLDYVANQTGSVINEEG
ncbi:MAG: flagellin [Desulfovibrio sp.]